ncbi:MAG: glycosyltransferase family 4 protein [Acidimicrobiales bacterium]
MSGRRLVTVAGHLGSVGGTEAAQLAIFTELAGRGWEIHLLYASRGDYWARWEELAATTTQIRASLPSPSAPVTSTLGTIHGALAGTRARPRAVYVHNAGDVPLALSVATATGSKVVAHLHLPPPSRQPGWLDRCLRRAAAVITPSQDTAARWIDGARLEPARVRVIPLGIDVDRFVPLGAAQRAEVRSAIGVGEDETMVLYVGRVERIKGAHFLLEAVGRLSEPVHVVVCGAANDEAYLAELVAMDGRSSFLGRRSDVPALMAAADLVAMPSNWLETQGLVLGEAMACGTPVVASDVGGLSATLRGFPDQLVPPADPGRLAAAIERFGHWRRTEPDLGARSRQWVVEHLSLVASVDAIEAVLIGADRRGAPDGPR